MEKFTKGGWEFDRSIDRVVDAEGETICATGDSWSSYRNSKANAALIACAPEMYEMLKKVSQLIDNDGGAAIDWLIENTFDIRELLAKARGES